MPEQTGLGLATKFPSKILPDVFGIDLGAFGDKPFRETLDTRSFGAKGSIGKRVAEMVMQEYVTRFAKQTAEATNTLTIFAKLRKPKSI